MAQIRAEIGRGESAWSRDLEMFTSTSKTVDETRGRRRQAAAYRPLAQRPVATDMRLWLRGAIDAWPRSWSCSAARCSTWQRTPTRSCRASLICRSRATRHVRSPSMAYDAMFARDGERLSDYREAVQSICPAARPRSRARSIRSIANGWQGNSASTACAAIRRTPWPTADSPSSSRPWPRSRWCTCRASARNSCLDLSALRLHTARRPVLHWQLDHAAGKSRRTGARRGKAGRVIGHLVSLLVLMKVSR